MMKLLVADSDADMVEMLTSWLRTRGYHVKYALSAERIRSEWLEQQPDLVIVDAGLKGVDVLGLCRELRGTHDALILAIAAGADAGTQVRCLESGADAYLPKPYLPAQLLAHIHALSRRVRSTLLRSPSSILTVGPIRVDSLRNEVSMHGKVTRLTPTESKLLHLLAINANDVCTLDQIAAHVWGFCEESDTTLIKAHIRHLREKIEGNPSAPRHIVTVTGSGYMLVRQPDQKTTDTVPAAIGEADEPSNLSDYREAMRTPHQQEEPFIEQPATYSADTMSDADTYATL
jgi:DNA-binding response OmpR family regulator